MTSFGNNHNNSNKWRKFSSDVDDDEYDDGYDYDEQLFMVIN